MEKLNYDIIIVGAGTARSVLASRFSEDSLRSILLLEAKPDYPTIEATQSEILNCFRPTCSHDRGYYSD